MGGENYVSGRSRGVLLLTACSLPNNRLLVGIPTLMLIFEIFTTGLWRLSAGTGTGACLDRLG